MGTNTFKVHQMNGFVDLDVMNVRECRCQALKGKIIRFFSVEKTVRLRGLEEPLQVQSFLGKKEEILVIDDSAFGSS
jgi:hypothetical protein